jgi:1-aminocyclopropane-1-carboxylate deaminase
LALLIPHWQPQAPLEPLTFDWSRAAGIELAVLRLDLIDPLISGNKWFKLAPYLTVAAEAGFSGLMSLGGAHSNHLHALAAAGQRFAFTTVGLLRGEPQDTPTVRDLHAMGMQLHWLGYGGYRARHASDFWLSWQLRYPHLLAVAEGGLGLPAARSCDGLRVQVQKQLAALGWQDYDGWWLAAGTGTTLAGLVMAEAAERPVYGALAVPAGHGVETQVAALLTEAGMANQGYHLIEACRGGFARVDPHLLAFMAEAEACSGMRLEPLYTAKALLALRQQVEAGYFAPATRLVFVHTGGLQGRRALLAS